MSVELATVGIDFRTDKVKAGEEVTVRAFDKIGAASDRMAGRVERTTKYLEANAQMQQRAAAASQATASVSGNVTAAQQRHADAVEQMTVAQARLDRLRQMSTAQLQQEVAAILRLPPAIREEELAILKLAGAMRQQEIAQDRAIQKDRQRVIATIESMRAAEAASQRTVAAANATGAATGRSAVGVRTAQNALNQLAFAAAGIPGPIGRVASSLGTLAVGGAATVAVIAGLSAIVAVIDKLTAASRAARDASDALNTALDGAAESYRRQTQPVAVLNEQLTDLVGQQAKIRDQLERERNTPTQVSAKTGTRYGGPDLQEIRRLEAELVRVGARAGTAMRQANEQLASNNRAVAGAVAGTTAAFGSLLDFQQDAARAIAMAHGDTAQLIELEYADRIARVEELFAGLSAAGQRDAAGLRAEWIKLLEQGREAERLLTKLGPITPRVVGGNNLPIRGITTEFGVDPRVQDEADRLAFERAAQSRYEAALRTTTDAFQRGFAGIWEHGYEGFAEFFDAVTQLAVQAAASIASAMAVEALGIDKLLKNLAFENGKTTWNLGRGFKGEGAFAGNAIGGFVAGQLGGQLGAQQSSGFNAAAVGGLSGAAAGFAVGGPVGAIVGGVTGLVSGLLGQGERAREAARRMEEAQKAFDLALKSYVDAAYGRNTQLSQALDANSAQADALKQQAKDIAMAEFNALSIGDLADGAAAPIFEGLREEMKKIDEASALLTEQLKAEMEVRKQQIGEDLRVRALRAQGRDAEADAMALSLSHARERAAFEKELGDQFTKNLQDQLAYVQALEVEAVAKAKAADAARKAAELAEQQARLVEDLSVRQLAAAGQTEAADTLRRRIAYEREYNEAVKAGMDEGTLALLRQVQAAEELAIAQAKAAEAAQKLIDSINAEARATEGLTVRHLRATGSVEFANEQAMLFEQQEEKRRAMEEGRSAAYMAYLEQVQTEERAFADEQRRERQQAAFDDAVRSAFPADATFLPESKTSVNLAVGVSESTVNRMVGVLQSQLVYQSSLPKIESSNAESVALLRAIATALGGNLIDLVDRGLATAGSDGDLAAGLPPGNR